MRRLTVLPILVLAACADAAVLQPEPEARPGPVAFDQAAAMPGAMEFVAQVTFVGTVDPGFTKVTPSGVIHGTDLVNEWAVAGDLVGRWYFMGKYHINSSTGAGRSVTNPAWFEIQSSKWGMTGTFECNASFRIENFPTDAFIQYGTVGGCRGAGDFAGKNLRYYVTNEANPGMGGPGTIYDFRGVIW